MSKPPIILYRVPDHHKEKGAEQPVDIDFFTAPSAGVKKEWLANLNGLKMKELDYLIDLASPPHDPGRTHIYGELSTIVLAIHEKSSADFHNMAKDGYITLREIVDYAKKNNLTDAYVKQVDDARYVGNESYSVAKKLPIFSNQMGLENKELMPLETVHGLPKELQCQIVGTAKQR